MKYKSDVVTDLLMNLAQTSHQTFKKSNLEEFIHLDIQCYNIEKKKEILIPNIPYVFLFQPFKTLHRITIQLKPLNLFL